MNLEQPGQLYPALSLSSFGIKRDLVPRQFKLPEDVDSALTQEPPKQQSLQQERDALARWQRLLETKPTLPPRPPVKPAEGKSPDKYNDASGAAQSEHDAAISNFVGITGASPTQARKLLEANGWNLERSIHSFYEGQG